MANTTKPVSLGTTNEDTVRLGQISSNYKNLVPGTYATEKGATVTITSNTWTYDPRNSATLQALDDDGPTADRSTVDTITVPMKSGGKQVLGTVTVTGVNDAPTAINHALEASEDTTYSGGNLLSGSFDPDDQLTAGLVSQPAHGIASVNPNGSYTYTPNGNYNGLDQFTFSVSDGQVTLQRVLNISVAQVNDAPVITNGGTAAEPGFIVPENTIGVVGTIAASDPDGPAQSFIWSLGEDSDADTFRFDINRDTGELILTEAQDYESTEDGADNLMRVTVQVSDGTTTTEQYVWVGVSDTDEPLGTVYPQSIDSVSNADVDKDGDIDLVFTSSATNSVGVLLNRGDGTFVSGASDEVPDPQGGLLADFNEDTIMDYAVANTYGNAVGILLGNGDGSFSPQVLYPGGSVMPAVASFDLNEDGHLDVVSTSYYDNAISVLFGNGDGTFQPRYTVGVGGVSNYGVTVADLGNGHGSIIVATPVSSTISILMGDGTGNFAAPITLNTNATPLYVTVANLGDGKPDIIVGNRDTSTVQVFRGNGDGSFQPVDTYNVGSGTYRAAVGDMNGDGILDLVTANAASKTVSILVGNGDETFQPEMSLAIETTPYAISLADLNNDNRTDIAVGGGDGTTVLHNNTDFFLV
ncbi:FG-GAP-like repeat-containing protein [Microvirga sp. 0TCS3.31]